jgi:hypothetical protein
LLLNDACSRRLPNPKAGMKKTKLEESLNQLGRRPPADSRIIRMHFGSSPVLAHIYKSLPELAMIKSEKHSAKSRILVVM